MTTFTPEEIKQAQESPRVGDVWRGLERDVTVVAVTDDRIFIDNGVSCDQRLWDWWTGANATLVKRGPA